MTIGYTNPGYPVERNILGKCFAAKYVRVRSFDSMATKLANVLRFNLISSIAQRLKQCAFHGGIPEKFSDIDLMHFFNTIALPPSKKTYVTTFETFVPRSFASGGMMRHGLASLLSDRCRKLIALSEHAKLRQMAINAEYDVKGLDKKITVLLPPQETLALDVEVTRKYEKFCGGPLKLIFCGKDFFRKGGSEIVRSLIKVKKEFDVEAYLIGDYDHVDYASSWALDSDEEMRKLIGANSGWLHHYKQLSNKDVLDLARECHIGFLPTRDDTFGYSVLEFQACGLPCITTDSRALPEVNNDEVGWLVKVPKLANGCADFSTVEKMRELSVSIEEGLEEKLQEALSKPEMILQKGLKSLVQIKRNHDPVKYGLRLGEIYQEAIE